MEGKKLDEDVGLARLAQKMPSKASPHRLLLSLFLIRLYYDIIFLSLHLFTLHLACWSFPSQSVQCLALLFIYFYSVSFLLWLLFLFLGAKTNKIVTPNSLSTGDHLPLLFRPFWHLSLSRLFMYLQQYCFIFILSY